MGRKCLIDMVMRGVQRPGCSTGNKNRRGPYFMLYILLISYKTAEGGRVGLKREDDGSFSFLFFFFFTTWLA